MADAMVGNILGVAEIGSSPLGAGGPIIADGASAVTVTNSQTVKVGASYDIVDKNTGVVLASNRQVTAVSSAGVVNYSGADVNATPGTHVLVPTGTTISPAASTVRDPYTNLNGGSDISHGFDLSPTIPLDSIGSMKEYLLGLGLGAYTAKSLNSMTYNDLVYACRTQIQPSGLKSGK